MLVPERSNVDEPVVFCLHYLGGSAREWSHVGTLLEKQLRCVAIDLPGFGDAAQTPGYTVADMAAIVTRAIAAQTPRRWMIAGHSMGAKIAAVIARNAENGAAALMGLEGLVLLAGSPPGPEPMSDEQRQTMRGWFSGDAASNRVEAQRYIAQNSGPDLDARCTEQAVADVLRANHAAWRAWLDLGSREDWSERVDVLRTPTLLIAGENDTNLGPSAQQRLLVPHFKYVRLVTLADAKHLLPMERPHEVARLIGEHMNSIDRERRRSAAMGENYSNLIASDRVGSETRRALVAREQPDDPSYEPVAVDWEAFATLRAMVARLLPQDGSMRIDLAARIDRQLGSGASDGWRFAALPPDAQAYRAGLLTLSDEAERQHGKAFTELAGDQQDRILTHVAGGLLGSNPDEAVLPQRLNAGQMQLWFEDVRSDAVKVYVAHPATLARMGYSGIANGGDGEPKSGFVRVGVDEREAWEPVASTDSAL